MLNSTFKKYKTLISKRSKTWSKSEIDSFKNLLNRKHYADDDTKKKTALLDELFYEMMLKKESLNIEKSHSKQGINYLLTLAFKSNGDKRNTKSFPFNGSQLEILKTFKKFTFQGYLMESELTREHTYYDRSLIVFRVHSKSGAYFDYSPVHWSNPIIIKEDDHGYPYMQKEVNPTLILNKDDLFKTPRLDENEIDSSYIELETLFCDSSGFGSPSESALTVQQAENKIESLIEENNALYGAITSAGQFQVNVTIYKKAV